MRGRLGFTLIELLVVITIIASLAVLVFPQFGTFNKSSDLQNAAATLQTALRNAQNNATSGIVCWISTSAASSWNIKFDVSSYSLEATCVGSIGAGTPTPPAMAKYNLPKGVSISGIQFNGCSFPVLATDQPKVIFANISGAISFESGSSDCPVGFSTTKMTVILSSSSGQKSVIIEKGGSIYVSSE